MSFQVWNTDTDQPDSGETFETQEEASAAMLAKYPVTNDGKNVPIAIKEVEDAPMHTLTKRRASRKTAGWTGYIVGTDAGGPFELMGDPSEGDDSPVQAFYTIHQWWDDVVPDGINNFHIRIYNGDDYEYAWIPGVPNVLMSRGKGEEISLTGARKTVGEITQRDRYLDQIKAYDTNIASLQSEIAYLHRSMENHGHERFTMDLILKLEDQMFPMIKNRDELLKATASRKTAKSDFEQGYEDRMADRPRKIPEAAEGTQVGASDEWRERVMEYDRGYFRAGGEIADALFDTDFSGSGFYDREGSKKRPTGRVNVAKKRPTGKVNVASRKTAEIVGWREEGSDAFSFSAGGGEYAAVVFRGSALEGDTAWSFDLIGPGIPRQSGTGFGTYMDAQDEVEARLGWPLDVTGSRKTASSLTPASNWGTNSRVDIQKELARLSEIAYTRPDLIAGANSAYDKEKQSWFDSQSIEDLVFLWEVNPMGMNFGWDDEVYEALMLKGYFSNTARKAQRKTAMGLCKFCGEEFDGWNPTPCPVNPEGHRIQRQSIEDQFQIIPVKVGHRKTAAWVFVEGDDVDRHWLEKEIMALGGHVTTYRWNGGFVAEADRNFLELMIERDDPRKPFGPINEGDSPSRGGIRGDDPRLASRKTAHGEEAMRNALNWLSNATSDSFSKGGDREVRRELARALGDNPDDFSLGSKKTAYADEYIYLPWDQVPERSQYIMGGFQWPEEKGKKMVFGMDRETGGVILLPWVGPTTASRKTAYDEVTYIELGLLDKGYIFDASEVNIGDRVEDGRGKLGTIKEISDTGGIIVSFDDGTGEHFLSSVIELGALKRVAQRKTARRLKCRTCDYQFSTDNQFKVECPNCGSIEVMDISSGSFSNFGQPRAGTRKKAATICKVCKVNEATTLVESLGAYLCDSCLDIHESLLELEGQETFASRKKAGVGFFDPVNFLDTYDPNVKFGNPIAVGAEIVSVKPVGDPANKYIYITDTEGNVQSVYRGSVSKNRPTASRKSWTPKPGDRVKVAKHEGKIVSEDLPGFYVVAFDDGVTVNEIAREDITRAGPKKVARLFTANNDNGYGDPFAGVGMAVEAPNMVDIESDEVVDVGTGHSVAVKKTAENNWDTEETMRWAANTEAVYWALAEAQGPSEVENIIHQMLDGVEYFDVDFDEVDWYAVWEDVVELHSEAVKKNEKFSGLDGYWEAIGANDE